MFGKFSSAHNFPIECGMTSLRSHAHTLLQCSSSYTKHDSSGFTLRERHQIETARYACPLDYALASGQGILMNHNNSNNEDDKFAINLSILMMKRSSS